MSAFGDEELIRDFWVESYDDLDQLDQDFVALERDPSDRETLSRVFRCVHTIKGTCGFLGFSKLESVAHAGEDLLSRLRDGDLHLTPEMTNVLLRLVDAVREILGSIESQNGEGDTDYSDLVASLERLNSGETHPAVDSAPPMDSDECDGPTDGTSAAAAEASGVKTTDSAGRTRLGELLVDRGDASVDEIAGALLMQLEGDNRRLGDILVDAGIVRQEVRDLIVEEQKQLIPLTIGELLLHSGAVGAEDVAKALRAQLDGDARPVGKILEEEGAATKDEVADALAAQSAQRETPQQAGGISDSTIRVDVELLDNVLNMVGELVLSRNEIVQYAATQHDMGFTAASQRLNIVTTELQEGVMKTRMQPIGNVWNKFPRIVRDMSQSLGKKIRIEMEGENTELDKTILEAIKDPLTHVVRNSADHGLETPGQRAAAGKPEEGCITMRVFHEGGQVHIEIADDGAGIDVDRVRAKAIEKNVISRAQGDRMSDQEALNLIFRAGLSTAKEVTNISGRGVGMDVVRANIEKIGGTVEIASELGQGTTLRIKLPLTLAIIPALIVTTGGERYAIPQANLLELVRLGREDDNNRVEHIHGSPVYRLRGNLLPLVDLGQQLEMSPHATNAPSDSSVDEIGGGLDDMDSTTGASTACSDGAESINIVVLQAEGTPFGLIVDQVHDMEEIVVKPLGNQLKHIPIFAGATIMGDGDIALILDVLGMAQRSNVLDGQGVSDLDTEAEEGLGASDSKTSVLLFRTAASDRMALKLREVDRLEEFPAEVVEATSSGNFVQYRGTIMRLIKVAEYLPECGDGSCPQPMASPEDKFHVVVYSNDSATVGFHVGEILDVVDETVVETNANGNDLIRFNAIVQGRVTEFLNPDALISMVASGVRPRLNRERVEI